jgi:MerR family transcriptional regulator, mercuric resistance operon regulatory protein
MVRSQDVADRTIAGLARAGDVGVETIRYYQRRGLLAEPKRPPGPGSGGGVRRYGDEDVRRLRFIRAAQAGGFSLDEIAALLALDATEDRPRARQLARARLDALDRRIAALQATRAWLSDLERECARDGAGPCPILQAFGRTDPAP